MSGYKDWEDSVGKIWHGQDHAFMRTAQRQESNSDHAWMVPNKAEVGCQVHKALGLESYLCQ